MLNGARTAGRAVDGRRHAAGEYQDIPLFEPRHMWYYRCAMILLAVNFVFVALTPRFLFGFHDAKKGIHRRLCNSMVSDILRESYWISWFLAFNISFALFVEL